MASRLERAELFADTTITVDDDGFIIDYPGLATRI